MNIPESDDLKSSPKNKSHLSIDFEPRHNMEKKTKFLHYLRKIPFLFMPGYVNPELQRIRVISFPACSRGEKCKYASNAVSNRKYNIISFLPKTLYEQFRSFVNFYFLILTLSQLVSFLKTGPLYTYAVPLCFVVLINIAKELYDETKIYQKDKEYNSQMYKKVILDGFSLLRSADIRVGDLLVIEKNQRVPADLIILKNLIGNTCFIRTDQLDGETDWKLRVPIAHTQTLPTTDDLFHINGFVTVEAPKKDIHSFVATMTVTLPGEKIVESLSLDNTIWHNSVLASGSVVAMVVYTGKDTRASRNQNLPTTKIGKIDEEINRLSKPLIIIMIVASILLTALSETFKWYIVLRYVVLLSTLIPMSMRVNLDISRIIYVYRISKEPTIPGSVVRNSNIPEEAGRIDYILTDKTGTLTKNEMKLKRLSTGTRSFGENSGTLVKDMVKKELKVNNGLGPAPSILLKLVFALALGNSVIPVEGFTNCYGDSTANEPSRDPPSTDDISYKSPSPDEISIVEWAAGIGVQLCYRDRNKICLRTSIGILNFEILETFPFSSELKRMGIIIRDLQLNTIFFVVKGADSVMEKIVIYEDWLKEECDNFAREGLRTLVVGQKELSLGEYTEFKADYERAKCLLVNRYSEMNLVVESLEKNLKLLGVTGIEDKLQDNVRETIESLRNAGIKIWMLTGDKVETALCIAISSRLVSRDQPFYVISQLENPISAECELNNLAEQPEVCLVMDGVSLNIFHQHFRKRFTEVITRLSSAIFCRCSPTQKQQLATMIKTIAKKRVCAVGDGGNDVSMIKVAHYGIGIEGKEGRYASLAADISIKKFYHIATLILWFGRTNYKRSAKIVQLIIYRGVIFTAAQIFFSLMYDSAAVGLHYGLMQVCFATVYTSLPIFACILDRDMTRETSLLYPELYREIKKEGDFCWREFLIWLSKGVYQGGLILFITAYALEEELTNISLLSFTSMFFVLLITVASNVIRWNWIITSSYILSLIIFLLGMAILPDVYNPTYIRTMRSLYGYTLITTVACLPLMVLSAVCRKINPPNYAKLQ